MDTSPLDQDTSTIMPCSSLTRRLLGLQVFRFGIVSTISTVLDYMVLALTARLLHLGAASMSHSSQVATAVAVGYLVGTLVNFCAARRWVFRGSSMSFTAELCSVFIVGAIGLVLTEIITVSLTSHMHLQLMAAKTVAVAVVFFWNFFARRMLIYRPND